MVNAILDKSVVLLSFYYLQPGGKVTRGSQRGYENLARQIC